MKKYIYLQKFAYIYRGNMSFSKYFKLTTALLVLLTEVSFAASSGKVRFSTGEVHLFRKGTEFLIHGDKNKPENQGLKPKNKVKQDDNIRTFIESQAIIALPDGSRFSIQENTDLTITGLKFENGDNVFTTVINNGKMGFDVQKQKTAGKFKFKTGTATAAIRGTAGVFGSVKGRLVASLRNGEMVITDEKTGKNTVINGGQTVLGVNDSLIVLDLKSSGDSKFLNELDSLLSDTTKAIDLETLIKSVNDKDADYQKRLEAVKSQANCTVQPLPDTIYTSNNKVSVQCNQGILVGIYKPVLSTGEPMEFEVGWESTSIGIKNIDINCYLDSLYSYPYANLKTYYAGKIDTTAKDEPHQPLTITSSSPLKVCSPASATIEGTFDPRDSSATLIVKLGSYTSANLVPVSANGKFSQTIQISDKNNNWNEKSASVTYTSQTYGTETATIDLEINKSCKDVNTISPKVSFVSYDSLQCWLQVNFSDIGDEYAIYTHSVDGTPGKEVAISKDLLVNINLQKGRHDYVVKIADQAEHASEIRKSLGCYKAINGAKISIPGENPERIRVPPTPPKNFNTEFYRNLRFDVTGLPGNNPDYIKEIKIAQNGKRPILLRGSDLTAVNFDQQITLNRGTSSKVNITVILKSGQILNATKTYEVR